MLQYAWWELAEAVVYVDEMAVGSYVKKNDLDGNLLPVC